MPVGLPVSRILDVNVSLAPQAVPLENFQSLMVIGDTPNVIDTFERFRTYGTLPEVAGDFLTTSPEYLAAKDLFAQVPQPDEVFIGFWAHAATSGRLVGGLLSGTQQAMSAWTSITTGSFRVFLNTVSHDVTGLNFSGATNLNAVAAIIQTALNTALAGTTCVWDATNDRFIITAAGSTGTTSVVSFLTAVGSGVDISAQLLGTAATASWAVAGIAAEAALAAVVIFDGLQQQWYGLTFATGALNAHITDSDHLAIAGYIEASGVGAANPHIYGLTTGESTAILPNNSTDIGSECLAAGYERTFGQYSTTDPYAVTSMYGRLLTVDFTAANSTLDLMWKREPGVTPETNLNTTSANALDAKRYSYYTGYALSGTNTAIITNGTMFGPAYIDEIFNLDALANRIQVDLFNRQYEETTKIPQTDAGMNSLVTTCQGSCDAFVNNGFLAPGVWDGDSFGALQTGQVLSKGYYVFAPKMATQSASDRAARKSTTIQIAGKEAGAINTVKVNIVVDR